MNRTTIDFGIDLGTTNSAISVLRGVATEIIKNNDDSDITPSAVYIGKDGQVQVGVRARNNLTSERKSKDTYAEFKRRMGSDFEYEFKSSGMKKTPEELSAEVLKELRGNVQQRLGEDIHAVVITIPAAFEQRQCAATRKAAELAGFQQVALLQEPVAASLAYGFQQGETEKRFWLVFDFGGGTFDAALMKSEDGDLQVVNHGGDNYLGGADIDWAIVNQLIIPKLTEQYNLPDFKRGSKRWTVPLAKIKRAVEMAKIDLSRKDRTVLEWGEAFEDEDGNDVDLDGFPLASSDVEQLARPLILKAVEKCKQVLAEKNLTVENLSRVILVGGPTLAPYFRGILKEEFGDKIDFSVDPMTVVSRGAAIFAGTQKLGKGLKAVAKVGEFNVDLKYEAIGSIEDPRITGEISSPDKSPLTGFSLEIVNRQTNWRSGRLPLNDQGRFSCRIRAEAGMKNDFELFLTDAMGTRQKTVPETFSYTMGMTVKAQVVTNDLSLALADNKRAVFAQKGESYPFRKTDRSLRTVRTLKSGSDDTLRFPIVEGNEEMADWNPRLGELVVTGRQIRRDIPAGSDVELTLKAEEPGSLVATAFIPLVDEEFSCTIEYAMSGPTQGLLQEELQKEKKRIQDAGDKINLRTQLQEAEQKVGDARDPDAAKQAQKDILNIRIRLDKNAEQSKWPEAVEMAKGVLQDLDNVVSKFGTADQQKKARDVHAAVDSAIESKNIRALERAQEKALDLGREIRFAQPGFWIGFLQYLEEEKYKMTNQERAERLINQGYRCAQMQNLQGLRQAVAELLELLPQQERAAAERGYGAGVVK